MEQGNIVNENYKKVYDEKVYDEKIYNENLYQEALYDIHNDNDNYSNFYINNNNILIDLDIGVCMCNPKNTELDTLILFFCYLYTDCKIYPAHSDNDIDNDIDDYDCNYAYIDDFHISKDINYEKIQKIIKEKTEFIFMKNYLGFYPLDFIITLEHILDRNYKYTHTKNKDKLLIIENLYYLQKIKIDIDYQYDKLEAFEYIINSNHIGNDTTQLQLPIEMWEYIFTFI